ncbi:MAG: radical SAM protein [Dehalococcoidales bacterium]|nr:radical SAM protein [Dehalococcoidales bacterium]
MGWDEIEKARRRLSREQGTVIKDWGGRIPVALVYPNSYYLGMSNLGVHALYRLLNGYDNVVCERVFWEAGSTASQSPPLSLESQRPLSDFAALFFSISYELDYFNVVRILKASGIPLYAADRDERHPLVIAGGSCIMANLVPLSPFFDGLAIGEAEPLVPAMLPVITEGIGGRRSELLKSLSVLPGLYIPRYYSGKAVVRQWAKELDDFPVASVVLTPDTELGDLYLIEVERGCNWGCRFCLVSQCFSPMRLRSLDSILTQAEAGLKYRKRLGLVGAAVSAHPQLEELLPRLTKMGAELSLSSLRIAPLSSVVLRELARGGAKTITLAPEAGSPRLRQMIKKGISEDDILRAVSQVAEQGIKQLKLYFIIGLPSETDEDIEAIINLALRCKETIDRKRAGCRLTLNISPFVPKAGTPFQWLPMEQPAVLNRRLSRLKNSLMPRGIKVKGESPAWSQVQGVLARGDIELAEVLADVEELSLAAWRESAAKHDIDVDFYAHQRWDIGQKLPWAMIELGTKAGYQESELGRALDSKPDFA